MEKKYKIRKDLSIVKGHTLYRIEALKDFSDVKKGDIGGYVRNEENLSHEGDCWVYDEAKADDFSRLSGNAKMYDHSELNIYAQVRDSAVLCDNALVTGDGCVCESARVQDGSRICGNAIICGIYTVISGFAEIGGNVTIKSNRDYQVFRNTWSSFRYFTYTRPNRMWRAGCFYGIGEQLIRKAFKDSEISGTEYKRVVEYTEAMYANIERVPFLRGRCILRHAQRG